MFLARENFKTLTLLCQFLVAQVYSSLNSSSGENVFDSSYSDGEQLSYPIAPTEQSDVDATSVSEDVVEVPTGLSFQEQRYYQEKIAELEKQAEQFKVEIKNQHSQIDKLSQVINDLSKELLDKKRRFTGK